MKDQGARDNWQLQEDGPPDERWILQDSEQNVSDQWALQDTFEPEDREWQPVEYVKPRRPAIAWVLPAVITVALLAVVGYTAVQLLPSLFGPGDEGEELVVVPAETTPEAQAPVEVVPEEATAAPVEEAAPTAVAAEQVPTDTPPPAPTPIPLAAQRFAVVNSPYGVNARQAPNTDAEIIRILEQGETLFVFDVLGEWVELFVSEAPLAEGQPLLGAVGYASSEFLDITTRDVSQQLVNEVLTYAGRPTPTPEGAEPVVEEAAPAEEVTTEAAPGEALPGLVLPTPTPSVAPAAAPEAPATSEAVEAGVVITIDAVNGVNVRREPAADDANVIRLLENGTVLPAVARSGDGAWIEVLMPDGVTGWIAADFVEVEGDLQSLPLEGSAQPAAPAGPPVAAGEVITSGVEPPAPYTSVVPPGNSPAVIVTVPDGVNARTAPSIDAPAVTVVPQGAVLPALARSTDSQWVQVELPTGEQAWIFRDTVTATPAVGALPPLAVETPTPTPEPAPAALPVVEPPTAPAEPAVDESEQSEPAATAAVRQLLISVFEQPDSTAATVARQARGTALDVLGRNTTGDWLQVRTEDGALGWVAANGVSVSVDVATLPVVQ